MMEAFRRILVDVDVLAVAHPALDLALDVATRCDADVTIVDVLGDVPSHARTFVTPALEQELVADRRNRLTALVAGTPSGVRAESRLLRGRAADAVIQEVLGGGYDLLVRSHARDPSAAPRLYGPVDQQLLRYCPCPVWLVDPRGGKRPRRLVAAVDAGASEHEDRQLNRTIVDLALMVREVEGSELTLVYAWSPFGEDLVRHRLSSSEFRAFVEAASAAASEEMGALVTAYGDRLSGVHVELLKGEPHEAIPSYVEAHEPDLVVMGTVGRRGLAGFLIGNTAERVLRQLRGSVLAVKPPGFVSPVLSPGAPAAPARRGTPPA